MPLTENEKLVLRCLDVAEFWEDSKHIGLACGQLAKKASKWTYPKLQKLVKLGYVKKQRARLSFKMLYRITISGQIFLGGILYRGYLNLAV